MSSNGNLSVPDSPRITVIVAAFNAAETIERCFVSVIEQDHPSVELLVVDGASTDGTVEVIERHRDEIAWWVSEPDAGVYDAWNKAVRHAQGDWICFLGSDDELARGDVMRRMAPSLANAEGRFRVVYGSIELADHDGRITGTSGRPWSEAGPRFPLEMSIPHPATFHHRSLFEEHGQFDESYRIGA